MGSSARRKKTSTRLGVASDPVGGASNGLVASRGDFRSEQLDGERLVHRNCAEQRRSAEGGYGDGFHLLSGKMERREWENGTGAAREGRGSNVSARVRASSKGGDGWGLGGRGGGVRGRRSGGQAKRRPRAGRSKRRLRRLGRGDAPE